MNKRLLIVTLAIGLATHVSGCSSSGSKENGDVAVSNDETFAEEGQGDFAENGGDKSAEGSTDSSGSLSDELGELNAENNGDKVAEEPKPEGGDDLAIKDNANQSPQDELSLDEGGDIGTEPKQDVAQQAPGAAETPNGDASALGANEPPKAEPPPTDEPLFGGEQPPPVADITEPPPIASNTDPSAPLDSAAPPIEPPASEPPPPETVPVPAPVAKTFAPLQKVKDQPFTKNGTLLNRVYVGRSGDTAKSVAKKIYGDKSRSKDLVKWNPILSRGVKTGDKIYYSSPHDPADSARMLTFYEDNNIPPSVYVSQEGDNIRKISKDFLGSSDSWKEVWATNPNVESKGVIPPGLEIRYWPEGAAASALASTQPPTPVQPTTNPEAIAPPPPDPQAAFPQEQAAMQQPPPPQPPPDMPPADMAPPPPPQPPPQEIAQVPPPPPQPPPSSGSVNAQGQDPLAPPTDPNMHQPPPVETKPVVKKTSPAVAEGEGTDTDTLISMAAGGILLVTAAVLLVVVRRNRAKKQAQAGMMGLGGDLGQTQV